MGVIMRHYHRLRCLSIAALVMALVVVAIPSARGATATEGLVAKSFHITVLRTASVTLVVPDATGTTGDSATPVGTYKVTEKQANPSWHWEGKVYAPYPVSYTHLTLPTIYSV